MCVQGITLFRLLSANAAVTMLETTINHEIVELYTSATDPGYALTKYAQ